MKLFVLCTLVAMFWGLFLFCIGLGTYLTYFAPRQYNTGAVALGGFLSLVLGCIATEALFEYKEDKG